MKNYVLICTLLICLVSPRSIACSAFSISDLSGNFVGKNYDWMPMHGHGAVFVNKHGVEKTAVLLQGKNPVKWTSQYGSITFTQMGREFAFGGMNQAGLVAEILELKETQHIDAQDSRPALNEAQWLQFVLDNFATLGDVITEVDKIKVEQAFLGVHYFVCDKTGECGVFEYLNGKLYIYNASQLPLRLLTNSTYEQGLKYLNENAPEFDPREPKYLSETSDKRFVKGAELLHGYQPGKSPTHEFAFKALKEMEMTRFLKTQWTVVYDQNQGVIRFHTREYGTTKSLSLSDFDFSCQTPVLMLNVQQDKAGVVSSRFEEFDPQANQDLIDENWLLIGAEKRRLAGEYPMKMTRCTQ